MASVDITAREVFEQFSGSAIAEIQGRMGSSGANASGNTSRSLRREVAEDELTIFGSEVFKYVEGGRGPSRKRGGSQESLRDRIKQWIKDKGIQPDDGMTEDSLAFLIARKIHNEGTLIYRTNNPRDIFSSVLDEKKINSLVLVISDSVNNQITSDIVKAFK